ncbi:MAG: signal recognition particle protein [Phycisphaerales bacterium]
MFERLSEGFSTALRNLSGKGKLTEANIRESMADVRTALLEADVHYDVVSEFTEKVVQESLGQDVTKSLKPGEQIIGIVHDELIRLMGGDPEAPEQTTGGAVPTVSPGPTVIMMCGLQGSGKTTTCGKLAALLKKRGRSAMLAAADLQRPAAVDQLQTIATQVRDEAPGSARVLFYGEPDKCAEYGKAKGVAVGVCQRAYKEAQREKVDVLILDTAGRLHINDELMQELEGVRLSVAPHQIYLVTDAMTGQDAVNSAKEFHQRLSVDGVILTKFDSDTRGGAALTVRKVTGAPIKFIGTGEKIDALEEFHPKRIAGRILGMGDVVSLVEKAQEQVSEQEAEEIAAKMAKGQLTMDDFLKQMKSLRRMGPMKQLMGMMPGMGGALKDMDIDEKQLDRLEGMVQSMTKDERTDVKVITNSRRKRIAKGSGVDVGDVGRLVKQFQAVSKLTKQMSGGGMRSKLKAMQELQAAGGPGMGMPMGGMPGMKGSTRSKSPKRKFKKRK